MKLVSAPEHLPETPGGWTTKTFTFGETSVELHLPADPDVVLDDEAVLEVHERTGYVPYWAHLWPAAEKMAQFVASQKWDAGQPILELGCGVGLVGLAALKTGARVVFSDCSLPAVQSAMFNANANGFTKATGVLLDWFAPELDQTFETILACDVLYEEQFHEPILNTLSKLLSPTGVCFLADPGRQLAADFLRLVNRRGFDVFAIDAAGNRWAPSGLGTFQVLCLSLGTRHGRVEGRPSYQKER